MDVGKGLTKGHNSEIYNGRSDANQKYPIHYYNEGKDDPGPNNPKVDSSDMPSGMRDATVKGGLDKNIHCNKNHFSNNISIEGNIARSF